MKKLNLGAGNIKIEGVESVDVDASFEPTHCFDLKVFPWPLEENQYDEIYFFHCIEHIEKSFHRPILQEVRRLLKEDGLFILSFPEFEIILMNWLENLNGMRGFWEANIYGLQRTKSDYHVSALSAEEMRDLLLLVGFKNIQIMSEEGSPHNTVIRCQRGEALKTYEKIVYDEVVK